MKVEHPEPARLSPADFLAVITHTPLVSIDLVLRNSAGAILLGRRVNEPAKGKWFVPGGRIYKDETLEQAFARISQHELGQPHTLGSARLLGVYTHRYLTNALLAPGVTTHYVVLAYELQDAGGSVDAMAQHSEARWFTRAQADADVHEHVLPYFPAPSS